MSLPFSSSSLNLVIVLNEFVSDLVLFLKRKERRGGLKLLEAASSRCLEALQCSHSYRSKFLYSCLYQHRWRYLQVLYTLNSPKSSTSTVLRIGEDSNASCSSFICVSLHSPIRQHKALASKQSTEPKSRKEPRVWKISDMFIDGTCQKQIVHSKSDRICT